MALCKYIRSHGVRLLSVSCQHLCDKPDFYKLYKHVEKPRKEPSEMGDLWKDHIRNLPWNERGAIMKHVRTAKAKARDEEFSDYRDEMIMRFQRLRPILLRSGGIREYIERKILENELLKQSFLEERVDYLGPDLGAAHFILGRGGRVKFVGHRDWITKANMKKLLPYKFVPGIYIVAIDATNTGLYYEGVDCLRYLNKLKWLRLKGCKNLNDFSLDIISGRYGAQLEYLDLTGCTGITHYGLESFYRFKCLKGLNVTGLDSTPEFHLTCLMIQDLLPDLDIIGVDFSQYLKEDAMPEEEKPILEIKAQGHDKSVV